MNRVKSDIWGFHEAFVVIPTNLEGVCGRGLARQMVDRFPGVGATLRNEGRTGELAKMWAHAEMLQFFTPEIANPGHQVGMPYYRLVPFPVKRGWKDEASLEMIERSCLMLARLLMTISNPYYCVMPQVGCGFGELTPEVVIPKLEEWLQCVTDRIILVEPDPEVFQKYAGSFKPGIRQDKSAVQANMPKGSPCGW